MDRSPSLRSLRVALNANLELSRDGVCKLAGDPTRWSGDPAPIERLARQLDVRPLDLKHARRTARRASSLAKKETRKAANAGATILTLDDDRYPASLRQNPLPPPVLYLLGEMPAKPAIAIVGSRKADSAGREAARLFARSLAESGLTVVSGFARGVDSEAHLGALEATHGDTVAVLGCGIDVIYPRQNRRLRERVRERGALVSEFPIGTSPLPRNFPVRNRIIASLTLGTLVVQAAPRSGSLITARLAVELGRDVWAIPGPIFQETAAGPNSLIRDGALLAQHPHDIVESLPIAIRDQITESPPANPGDTLEDLPRTVLDALPTGQLLSVDEVARRAEIPVHTAQAVLLELEISGRVRLYPGNRYWKTDACRESRRLW